MSIKGIICKLNFLRSTEQEELNEGEKIQEENSSEESANEENSDEENSSEGNSSEGNSDEDKEIFTINFCPKCGEKITIKQNFCLKCGFELSKVKSDVKKELKMKLNKHKRIIGLITSIVIILIVAISYSKNLEEKEKEAAILQQQQKEQEDQAKNRKEYVSKIKIFLAKTLIAGSNVSDINDTIQKYWSENIFDHKHGSDINEAIKIAIKDKASAKDEADSDNKEIESLFEDIKNTPSGCEDLQPVVDKISELYNSYCDFYYLTSPSGNYTEYSDNNNSKASDFMSKFKAAENSTKGISDFQTK